MLLQSHVFFVLFSKYQKAASEPILENVDDLYIARLSKLVGAIFNLDGVETHWCNLFAGQSAL